MRTRTEVLDVLTIGSALVDIFIESAQFSLQKENQKIWLCQSLDEKIEVDSFKVTTGGGGSNTAVGFAKLGLSAAIISELGHDTWAEMVRKDLTKSGVNTNFLIAERKEETGGSVILSGANNARTILVHRGAASMLDPADIPEQVIKEAGWIHLSSIAGRVQTLDKIFQLVKRHHKQLSWNPGKAELKLLAQNKLELNQVPISILLVNQSEWASISTRQTELSKLAAVIVVTAGKDGGDVYQNGRHSFNFSGTQVEVANATGAGDAFASGMVAAAINGESLNTQISWGQMNAASVIQQVGAKAGLLTREKMVK